MRHNNKVLFKIMLVVISLSSCNKYLDVNNDPNRVTDVNITPELLFTGSEALVGARAAGGDFLFLDHWVGYYAQNGAFAPQQNEISYNIDFSFCNAIFVNHMAVLFSLHQAEVKALVSGDTAVAAGSMVLAAKLWQELVDLYGNIPYSQAFNVNLYPTPAYDKAQDIYNSLELKLDTAIAYFGNPGLKKFAAADIIAGGDQGLWIKFANSLKLRLLIRQSQVSGFNPSADIAKILATGGVLGAGQSISVNPGYVNDVKKQNPYYANFGWDPTGVVSTSADNANNYIISILENTNDPRLSQFFYSVGFNSNKYIGAVFGDALANIPPASGLSYFGPGLVGTINSTNVGDGSGAKQNQFIIPSFESMFWYAEAVARGWIPGNAEDAYKAAVTESFAWIGVSDTSSASAYIVSNPDADFANAGTTPDSKATFIAYQKYIALTGIDPMEVFFDISRLHMLTDMSYVSIFPGIINSTPPVRLLYPQSEYTTNSVNVLKEGTINQFTSKLFWQP